MSRTRLTAVLGTAVVLWILSMGTARWVIRNSRLENGNLEQQLAKSESTRYSEDQHKLVSAMVEEEKKGFLLSFTGGRDENRFDPQCLKKLAGESGLSVEEYRLSASGGAAFNEIALTVTGEIGAILAFLERIPRLYPQLAPQETALHHQGVQFILEAAFSPLYLDQIVPASAETVPRGIVGEGVPLPEASISQMTRRLFSLYPAEKEPQQQDLTVVASVTGYLPPAPDWLSYCGTEKDQNGEVLYLFIDTRTGRLRKLQKGAPQAEWLLADRAGRMILTIDDTAYSVKGVL